MSMNGMLVVDCGLVHCQQGYIIKVTKSNSIVCIMKWTFLTCVYLLVNLQVVYNCFKY